MLQPQPNPRDDELLSFGLNAINQACSDGKITLKEWVRLRHDWTVRVLEDPDEMIEGEYSDHFLDS